MTIERRSDISHGRKRQTAKSCTRVHVPGGKNNEKRDPAGFGAPCRGAQGRHVTLCYLLAGTPRKVETAPFERRVVDFCTGGAAGPTPFISNRFSPHADLRGGGGSCDRRMLASHPPADVFNFEERGSQRRGCQTQSTRHERKNRIAFDCVRLFRTNSLTFDTRARGLLAGSPLRKRHTLTSLHIAIIRMMHQTCKDLHVIPLQQTAVEPAKFNGWNVAWI